MNAEADAAPDLLRVSLDAKATVKIGPFARGGKERVPVMAADHDFRPQATVTPVGLFLPQTDELFIYHVTSKVTSDCLVDCLEQWWEAHKTRFASITTLVLNLDNGPENHSHRTQFMGRLAAFGERHQVSVRLAYYPPYHSKYNPVERCWMTRPRLITCPSYRTIASTTRSNAAGAFWRIIGTVRCSTRWTRCAASPPP